MVSATSPRSRSPFDGLSSPTSARPSTARGTQGVVAAAHSAMGEAVGRFAPYAESAVPAFGGDRRLRARSIQPRRDGDPQHVPVPCDWMVRLRYYCLCICCCRYRRSRSHIIGRSRVRPRSLASGVFAFRGEGEPIWARPEALLLSASCAFLEKRLASLLLQVDQARWDIPHWWGRGTPMHKLQDHHSGDMTRRANHCAVHVACFL